MKNEEKEKKKKGKRKEKERLSTLDSLQHKRVG